MGLWILRLLLYLICGISGYFFGLRLSPSPLAGVWGLLSGLLIATLTLLMERGLKDIPLRSLIGSFIGLILGMMAANLVSNVFFSNLLNDQQITLPLLGGLWGLWLYRSPGWLQKRGGDSILRMESLLEKRSAR